MPSLAFALNLLGGGAEEADAALVLGGAAGGAHPALRMGLRPHAVSYVLDAAGDLPATRKTLRPPLEALRDAHGWRGAVGPGEAPAAFMRAALEEADLVVYCGHGAGEALVARADVLALPASSCAAAVLMGCSSGALRRKGACEPTGAALAYLAAGAPCVVANLWDVTDRDIDRFCIDLLDRWRVGGRAECPTLAHALPPARDVVKLRYLIGAAPVCYGLPVGWAD